ncbi:MAG: hypothetical protein JJU42_06080 [Rhodobacteraceae bacterium]|nr:hypothetical protein [Paracoccaceae bacterium]
MNLYHCMIDLKPNANPLAFAHAVDQWMGELMAAGCLSGWRLLRRKLNLAGPDCRDFLLEIEVAELAQLDAAFYYLALTDHDGERRYDAVHQMIDRAEFGLYRPFPDPAGKERLAIL